MQRLVSPRPLSRSQVQRALAFYRQQPGRYTPAIIEQIQVAVGSEATGTMAEDDVQAVANKQVALNVNQSPALKVDGMAGPRTLPQVFRIGLAKDDVLDSYTKAAAKAFRDPTRSEEAIAVDVVDKLMQPRLAALRMPRVKVSVLDDLGSRGRFSSADWELKLDRAQFQPGDKHDIKDTTATIYHECRHAEQDFKIGQMLAGTGKTVAQIIERTGLRPDVAAAAKDSPIAPGSMEALIAQGWDESLNSDAGFEARRRNSVELGAASRDRDRARAANKASPSPANAARQAAAEARFNRAVDEHDQLPHEFDAERLESRVRGGFDSAP